MYQPFAATSKWIDIAGPVHYLDFGGKSDGPPIVLVHGLGGSHGSWLAVGAGLAQYGRVVAIDLSGFGRTPPAERGSTVHANRRLLSEFLIQVVGEPAILVGNSMGATVAILQAANDPHSVAGLVLSGPAVPRALLAPIDPTVARNFALHAIPGVGSAWLRRRLERLGVEQYSMETLELVCADVDRVPGDVVDALIELRREQMAFPWLRQSFLDASRSLMSTLLQRRSFDSDIAAIKAPVLVIHGNKDRLVPEANVERLWAMRPDWQVEMLDDVGHVPQLEVPDLFIRLVGSWLKQLSPAVGSGG
ncbi:MAG: alpha/beta fold hydrolase [Acidimicrobiia bacterium]|nr:alpha/beta fold hydrolase [Acidimicrobiia bacterium]